MPSASKRPALWQIDLCRLPVHYGADPGEAGWSVCFSDAAPSSDPGACSLGTRYQQSCERRRLYPDRSPRTSNRPARFGKTFPLRVQKQTRCSLIGISGSRLKHLTGSSHIAERGGGRSMSASGQNRKYSYRAYVFRFTAKSRHASSSQALSAILYREFWGASSTRNCHAIRRR